MTKLHKVLIVDASKVIRASLAKYLKRYFTICEDTNGESAWQTLVLDNSISAIVSGCHLAKLDGFGLAERMHESKLSRLNGMPFFLVVSDTFSEEERARARQCGVSDFLPKNMAAAEMDLAIKKLIDQMQLMQDRRQGRPEAEPPSSPESTPADEEGEYSGVQSIIGASDVMGQISQLACMSDPAPDQGALPVAPPADSFGDFMSRERIDARLRELVPQAGQGQPVGLLVFGLDGYVAMASNYGAELAERVEQKISVLLTKKIRTEDSIGHLAPGRIVIVAPDTNQELCLSFANRVCKALAAAQISIRGQRVDMTVSVGIATLPEDGVAMNGQDLLKLAVGRLESAVRAGGNRVLSGATPNTPGGLSQEAFVARLKELLASTPPESMTPYLGTVGMQILPILAQLEQAFNFGLPIDEMGQRLWARARAERMTM